MTQSDKESGRSMIEILGMLAIAGILSVAAIAAYQTAMTKHRATTIIHEAHKRAVVAAGHINLYGKAPSLTEFASQNTTAGGTFGDATQEGLNQQFGIELSHVKRSVCHQVLAAIGPATPLRRLSSAEQPKVPLSTCGEDNTFLMIYNNDLSANDPEETNGNICALNEELSTGCTCPAHRSTQDGKCGDCEQGDITPWTQPTLSSNSDYGNLYTPSSENSNLCNADSHPAWCAFDGITGGANSMWVSTSEYHTILWELPNPIKISEVKFYNTSNANLFPSAIQIFASRDRDSWDMIGEASEYTKPSSSGYKSVQIDPQYANNGYPYIGFQFTQTGEESVAISEIKISAEAFTPKIYTLDSNLECQETHICEENEPLSSGCRCEEDRAVEDGKCAGCKSYIIWRKWSSPLMKAPTETLTSSAPISGSDPSADRCDTTSHPVWCAFEGTYSDTKKWFVETASASITWHLPQQLKLSQAEFYNNKAETSNQFPSSIVVYGSNNGTSWDILGTASGFTKPGKNGQINVTCDDSTPYTYWKFDFTNTEVDAIGIAEIRVKATYPYTSTPSFFDNECQPEIF